MNSLKQYSFTINEKRVTFKCSCGDKIIDFFIGIIKKEESKKGIIKPDFKVKINWGYYIFKGEKDEYMIYAPDYENNPFSDITEDLTLSLNIFNNQAGFINLTKLTPTDSDFQDTVIIKKSALNSNRLYFIRQQDREGTDSGWFLGDMNDLSDSNDPDSLMSVKEYELLQICPMAVFTVNLPVGTIVTIIDDEINTICDADDNEAYNRDKM